jgi:predicted nucleotidyltransferase
LYNGRISRYNGRITDLALIADELGVNERTLRRAINEGALWAQRPSPRTLDLSLAERRYIRRSWRLLAGLRAALRTEPNVRFALLFGSAASGTDTPASDIDVLVRLRDPSLERVVDLGSKLTAAVGRRVEVARLDDAEREPSFLAQALSGGRVLIDRERVWARLRQREPRLRHEGAERDARRARAALAGIDRLLP